MNQIILSILFQFITTPLERASFPVSYEFYGGAELEYSVEYVWESPKVLILKKHSAEDGDRRSVMSLNDKFQAVSDSIYGEDGALAYLHLFEYSGGKLNVRRSGPYSARFFYVGDNLDSVSETRNDTVLERFSYGYDSQDRPIRIDHFYSKGGGPVLDHNRSTVAYFLPDSIVIKRDFIPVDGDSVRQTIYLKDGLPIKMSETEYYSGSIHRSTHVWKFAGASSIRHGAKRILYGPAVKGHGDGNSADKNAASAGFNLLGRKAGGRVDGDAQIPFRFQSY
jgi:hypothetical protein